MNFYQINYSPAALDDLRSIFNYIALELTAPDTAKNQIDRIRKAVKSLSSFPKKNVTVDWEPRTSMGMRKLPVNNYVIFYTIDEENSSVDIIRLFYGGRNIQEIISRNNHDEKL